MNRACFPRFAAILRCTFLAAGLLAPAMETAGAQTPARIYEFNNSYAETNGGSAMVPAGGTLGTTGYTFAAGQGPNVSNALANTGEYTIEMVFRFDTVTGYRNILNFNGLTGDPAVYCLNGSVIFYDYTTGNSNAADLIAGQLHRVVITRNATTKVATAYVNGLQRSKVTDTNNRYVASASGGILHFFRDDGGAGESSAGLVDQIRIYNAVLTPAQVAAMPTNLPAISSPNLTAWQTQVSGGTPAVTHFTAVAGTSPVSINVGSFSAGSARSFEFVFNAAGAGASKSLLGSQVAASGGQYLKLNQWNNTGKFGLTTAGVADYVFNNSPTISNQPVHAVFTSNGSVTTLYLNGVLQTATVGDGLKITGTNGLAAFTTTSATYSDNLDGSISGFASYGRALSQAEVTARFHALVSPTTSPEINVTGNGVSIVDGDVTPSVTDHTDFGTVSSALARTFTIQNTGSGALSISSIVVSGTNASQFVVSGAPTSIAANSSASFTLTFSPNASTGTRSATVTINNNDADEAVYDFAVSATVASPPVVASVLPAGGPISGGTSVTITGTNFSGATGVTFGGVAATQVTVLSATEITCITPAGTAGAKSVLVTTPLGTSSANSLFTYVSPISVNYTSGNEVPVTSNEFAPHGNTIQFSLNFAPATGTRLMVVNNTGREFINGTFSNLSHGQLVSLTFGSVTYQFVANYHGGSGNDLVLEWATTRLFAWGYGNAGQLGIGTTPQFALLPSAISHSGALAGKTVLAVSGGFGSSLALCSDGTLLTWGDNSSGQLGNNTTGNSAVPVAVTATGVLAGKTPVAIASGEYFHMALCSDGTLVSWGSNQLGQLGNNSTVNSPVPVLVNRSGVLAGKKIVAISAGSYHGLALCSDGSVASWGLNDLGQLGNNTTTNSNLPVLLNTAGVLAGKTVVAASAGAYHGMALCSDGTLVAWGDNRNGALGNQSTTSTSVPILVDVSGVLAGKTVTSLALGREHSVVLCSDGTVSSWGYNTGSALGDGTTTNRLAPVLVNQSGVLAGKNVIEISSGYGSNFAYCSDGTLAAWGSNGYGQLGNNSLTTPQSPVLTSTSTLPAGARFIKPRAAKLLHSLAIVAQPTPPSLTSITPAQGSVLGGTPVTITGINFTGATAVTFGGVPATSFNVVNSNQITAVTPAGIAGPTSVSVTTATGTSAANSLFTYKAQPSLTSISPSTGTTLGGTSVIIQGADFETVTSVTFGGIASTIQSITPTTMVVTTPPRAAGPVNVNVTSAYGSFSLTAGYTYVLPQPGEVDPLNANIVGSIVLSTASQPDGKTLIGGNFSQVLGASRSHLARLLADGTIDPDFAPNPNGPVTSVVVQSDGKILLGGQFTSLQPNGASVPATRNRLARLNPDGTLDASFDPNANATVQCLALQPDGKILVAGAFTALQPNGAASPTTRNRMARLFADGSLDTVFHPNANDEVLSMAVQSDGGILLAGRFTTMQPNGAASSTARNRVARLNGDGTLDAAFHPNSNGVVNTLAVQADGKVLIGGAFTSLQPNGAASPVTRNRIGRLMADGSLDASFNPNANGEVNTMVVQADGNVLLGGAFTTLQPAGAGSATTRNRVARLLADGSLDTGFDPNANQIVYSLALQSDGFVLLGGFFTTLQPNAAPAPVSRDYFARLANSAATQNLSVPDTSRVLWTRGGSTPEISDVSFSLSTNGGSTWTPLAGNLLRVGNSAVWELTGLDLPTTGQILARGRISGGYQSGGSGLIEQITSYNSPLGPPILASVSPALGSSLGGDTVTLTGIRFTGATEVTIGGNPASNLTVTSPTTLTAVTPPGVAGIATVRVTTPGGMSAAEPLFTYIAAPTVNAVTPALGSTLGGNTVVITGAGFANVTAVSIGGNPATSYVVNSSSQITAVTPAGNAGTADVRVTITGASSAPNSLFTFVPPPTITTVNPGTGSVAGGQSVTITGNHLSLATSVTFGGVAAVSFTVDSSTQITATTPASSAGQKNVLITTPGGSNHATTFFTFIASPTTTTIVSSQNPSVFLSQPTFTARAESAQAGISGQIQWFVDDVSVETKTIDVDGYATFSPSAAVMNVGSRSVRAVYLGNATFATSSATVTQVVGKAPLTLVLGSLNQVYDGNGKSATVATNAPEGYGVNVGITYNGNSTAPVNAGTYAVAASINDPNFSGSTSGEMVITKAPLAFTVSPDPLVYNGNPRTPGLVFSPTGIPVSLTYQGIVNGVPTGPVGSTAPTNAGRYLATVATSSPNHQLTSTSFEFDVLKANASLVFHGTNQSYDGTPRVPTVFVDPLGIPITYTYQSLANGVPTGAIASQAPIAVGTYQIVPSSPNHQFTPATGVLNVAKRPVSIGIKGLLVSADGQPKPVTVTTHPPNIPVAVTYTAGGITTTTAPSAPPAGGGTWRVDVSPVDADSYIGSATGQLRIDTRVQPTMTLTGPAVTNRATPHAFTVTFGSNSRIKPTGSVYFRTLDIFYMSQVPIGADGRAIMTGKDYFLPVQAAPYQVVAEYAGDANFLPATSNVIEMRREKNTVVFLEYTGLLSYTGRPAEIPRGGLAFLYYNPNLVNSYSIRHNGSSILPTNVTTSPARIEVDYVTPFESTDYRDIINLTIQKAYARVKVGNLRQPWKPGGNPVQVTTDPAGLPTQVTYNGMHLPNGPTAPGTYSVVATVTDPNYRVYNEVEASGTLVVTQDLASFNVTNLFQNYDGREKPVSVSASPTIPYVVTYNGSTRPPLAPGTYDVRVFPENTATYGSGSAHTLVIRARVSATVNGQANTANLRLTDGAGNSITNFPAFLSPNQNEWRLEFVDTGDLKFVRWSDGSKENPRPLSFGTGSDPARFTFNAEAGQKFFLQAQTAVAGLPANSGGGATRSGYFAVGEMARFEAGTYGDAIINRWEYNGKTVTPADGHIILRDGREVYIKVVANGGNPICHITPGFIAEGFANNGNGTPGGTVELRRKDFMGLPALGQRFMPNGVNYVATAKPQSGYLFQGWESSRNSQLADINKRLGMQGVPGFPAPTATEEFMRVGTERYSSVFPRFVKDGPVLSINVSRHQRKVSASVSGVEIGGLRTANVTIRNEGSTTSGIRISRIQVTGFRLKRFNNSPWTYYYPFNRNAEEVRANQTSPMTNSEGALCVLFQPVIVNNEALNFWDPALFSNLVNSFADPMAVDYEVGSLNYNGSKDVSIVLGGLGQDVDFGPQAQTEVRFSFTLETNRGRQFVDAWWTDLNPTPAGLDPLSGW